MVLEFFAGKPRARALFEAASRQILRRFPSAALRVQKTQIAFDDPHGFAYLWMPPLVSRSHPNAPIVLSFVLPYPIESPRLSGVTFVRHDRYTHHMSIDRKDSVDHEVLGWLEEAHGLMRATRRRQG